MTKDEYLEYLEQSRKYLELIKNKRSYYSNKATPFIEYLEDPESKYVIAITKSQYVFSANLIGNHTLMTFDIIKRIRPDLKIDECENSYDVAENFREYNILIFGFNHFSLISIPSKEKLSIEQYKELEEILLNIKEYNKKNPNDVWKLFVEAPKKSNIEIGYYENRIDKLLALLENYITDDYKIPEEIIVGRPISKDKKL